MAADTLAKMRRKCPICSRMVMRRANGKLYRHYYIAPKDARPPCSKFNHFCEGTGRKVGR